jgi:addiction module HigA family antidote
MPITAIHPAEHLAEELEALGMSATELARQLKVPTNRITGILNGQRAITGDTALRGPLLWYQSAVLAQSPKSVRTASLLLTGVLQRKLPVS